MTAAYPAEDRDRLLERLKMGRHDEVTDTGTVRPIAEVNQPPADPSLKPLAWRVFRQYNHLPEHPVCSHRWGWVAELCAARRASSRRHANEVGVFYVARNVAGPKHVALTVEDGAGCE